MGGDAIPNGNGLGIEAADLFEAPPHEMFIDPNAEWQCAMCASVNKAESETCGACTYSKAKSVQSYLNLQEEKAQIAAALAASQADVEADVLKKVIKAKEEDEQEKDVLDEISDKVNDKQKNEKEDLDEPKSEEIESMDNNEQKEEKESKKI